MNIGELPAPLSTLEEKDLRVLLLKVLERVNQLEKQLEEHAERTEKSLNRLVEEAFHSRW